MLTRCRYRLIKLQERRAKRVLENAAAEAKTAAAPLQVEKKPETKKKDSVGSMKV